jgi:hypothetical protein
MDVRVCVEEAGTGCADLFCQYHYSGQHIEENI